MKLRIRAKEGSNFATAEEVLLGLSIKQASVKVHLFGLVC